LNFKAGFSVFISLPNFNLKKSFSIQQTKIQINLGSGKKAGKNKTARHTLLIPISIGMHYALFKGFGSMVYQLGISAKCRPYFAFK
jgi:hypothetical protein